jgi:hypothetical protein
MHRAVQAAALAVSLVIARSEATTQSSLSSWRWIASLRSQ